MHHRAAVPARGGKPPVTMTWYDGGKLPPQELFQGEKLISSDGGSLVIGTKGTLFTRTWHGGETDGGHVRAAAAQAVRGRSDAAADAAAHAEPSPRVGRRVPRQGDDAVPFSYASVLTESLLLGNVALRAGKTIQWDSRRCARRMPGGGRIHKADVPPGVVAVAERSGPLGNRCKSVEPLLSESCLD